MLAGVRVRILIGRSARASTVHCDPPRPHQLLRRAFMTMWRAEG
jgi:hypothetical protein